MHILIGALAGKSGGIKARQISHVGTVGMDTNV